MAKAFPTLRSCKTLKEEFQNFQEIVVNSDQFTIGRSLNNTIVIPFLAVSRNHCKLVKNDQDWFLEDYSSFGINVNGVKIGKGNRKKIQNHDVIGLDPGKEFVYKFVNDDADLMPSSIKRIKLEAEENCCDYINDMKVKFERSQNYEMKHIEDKILNTKQIKTTNILLKEQLQIDMKRKIERLECDYAAQIENLSGEKNDVEKHKVLLIQERDSQLAALKQNMEGKIFELMDQIRKHNEIESDLIVENNLLKEKLLKEREEFLLELSRESSLKQDMLDKLEAKMKEQEKIRLKEKQELETLLQKETDQLRLAKEKELSELSEQKKQRELELMEEVKNIKNSLEEQEKQKLEVQNKFNTQLKEMEKIKDEYKVKTEQLIQEQLNKAREKSEKFIEYLKTKVKEREVELAALAVDRIQKQAEQSGEVINSLQEKLEKVQSQLQSVESEYKRLLENTSLDSKSLDGPSNSTLTEFGNIMENELQCSICAELFVSAITLNCSHTFCQYCISMWKKKKKDCPICRAPITSECKSLVLDSFINKMVQNLSEEMKEKRKDMLKSREELETELKRPRARTSRRSSSRDGSSGEDSELEEEEGESDQEYGEYESNDDEDFDDIAWFDFTSSDTDSGPDYYPDLGTEFYNSTGNVAGASSNSRGRRRGRVPGTRGAYYGGYGRCFRCGARGHWAPGCPLQHLQH